MPYETVTHAGRQRLRFYPDGAIKLTQKDGLGVVYLTRRPEKTVVLAYAGNAAKASFHYGYRKAAEAEAKIKSFFDGLVAHEQRVAEYRKDRLTGHTLKVGDIILNSWGYDQTNNDWYRVVRISKCYVWLQEIMAQLVPSEGCSSMAGYAQAIIDVADPDPSKWGTVALDAKPITKHAAQGKSVTFPHGAGGLWDGQPTYESWYA